MLKSTRALPSDRNLEGSSTVGSLSDSSQKPVGAYIIEDSNLRKLLRAVIDSTEGGVAAAGMFPPRLPK